jgi:hypothetical protein
LSERSGPQRNCFTAGNQRETKAGVAIEFTRNHSHPAILGWFNQTNELGKQARETPPACPAKLRMIPPLLFRRDDDFFELRLELRLERIQSRKLLGRGGTIQWLDI